jgi:GNAT superfamily N-acetyltransferase
MGVAAVSSIRSRLTDITRRARRGFYQSNDGYGFRRDLLEPFPTPRSYPFQLRPYQDLDGAVMLDIEAPGLSPQARAYRETLRRMVRAEFRTCWVATVDDGQPAHIQWLITPDQNDHIASYWNGLFPPLAEDEVLMEAAYTLEQHRGRGLFSAAMAQIAEMGTELGARSALTYVSAGNMASIRGVMAAGFQPESQHTARWVLYRRSSEHRPLPEGFRFPFQR